MMAAGWLDPLRRALDARSAPLSFFLRDDDAGWEEPRLMRLLDLCGSLACPIDLAVIPAAVTSDEARRLLAWRAAAPARVGLHQHGWAHVDHEHHGTGGRKSEFGASRPAEDRWRDLAAGRRRLLDWFGDALDPVFTPPWNRCTDDTAAMLPALGLSVLSRDAGALPTGVASLRECPTHLDWFAKRRGVRLPADEFARRAAAVAASASPVGILLHHAVMDDVEFAGLEHLLRVLRAHAHCRPCSLLDAAARVRPTTPVRQPATAAVPAPARGL